MEPTIAARLERKFIVMCADEALKAQLRLAVPAGWEMVETLNLGDLGGFQDVLLHRFILLDLGEGQAFDPIEVLRQVRGEMMLNVPVFCFGGTQTLRDEARVARADRFFDREEIVNRMQQFCEQYGW